MTLNGIKVIDCHHHVGVTTAVRREGHADVADEAAADYQQRELAVRLATMDEMGVDQAIVIPTHGYLRPNGQADTERMNDMIAAYRDRTPDRFPAAVGVVEPLHGDASFRELHRIRDMGIVGVSFHVRFQGVSTNSAFVLALAREMAKIGLIPFVHAAAASIDEDWWKVQDFAEAVPDIPVIALDACTTSERSWEAIRVAQKTPNIYFDTSLSPGLHFILPVLNECGPERMVFGTDQYSGTTPHAESSRRNILDQLSRTDRIDNETKRLILSGNIERLLGLS